MKKVFDCVAMKHEIQARQRGWLKGLSAVEESRVIETEILKDVGLARIWKTAKRAASSGAAKAG